jgi:uncharacterized membrane protein (UPF0127 family)
MGAERRPIARRLRRLPRLRVLCREVPVALRFRARLLGLAWLRRERAGVGLLIPRCASVHTFGMRFPLDLVFLDVYGRPLAWRLDVPPRRLVSHRGAYAVLELPSPAQDAAGLPPRGESRPRPLP